MKTQSIRLASLAMITGLGTALAAPDHWTFKSPDQAVVLNLSTQGGLHYSVSFHHQVVVADSLLGVTVDGADLGRSAQATGSPVSGKIAETYPVLGVHALATNRCMTAVVPLQSTGLDWRLEVRIADDGVALRYRIPGTTDRRIGGESTAWNIPIGTQVWSQDAANTSYESRYEAGIVGQLPAGRQVMAPLALKFTGNTGYGLLTEANLVAYSDLSLVTSSNAFTALFRNDPHGWTQHGELLSPWRVTLLAADLNMLVNSDFIKNLCPPPAPELAQAKWIRPGRASWGWLSCYCGPKLEEQKEWIDRTKELGFEYYLIDDGWRDWNGGGDGAWSAMADTVKYARSQGVDIWVWVNAKYVHNPAERMAYFQRAKAMGIVGLKIDFPHAANVAWVNWYEDTLVDAAKCELMIDFHGALKPSGRERTWPHELTREAIAGREQGKSPSLHDLTLPFLRYVQGHADFTPTLFMPDRLKGSTYAHELAMAVDFTSPFLCYGDDPRHYLGNDAEAVIKALPSVWDETRVLPGSEIGEQVRFARRHGTDWFVGVLNDQKPRRDSLALDFLGAGRYQLMEWADVPGSEAKFQRTERVVTRKDSLTLPLATDGGYVAWLRPLVK